jgi:hypothetical protein
MTLTSLIAAGETLNVEFKSDVNDTELVIQSDVERARSVLGRLVDAGVLEARGEGRGRAYHLSAAMYRVLGDRAGYVRVCGFEPAQQEQMVLQYAQEHGQITRREVAELCKLSAALWSNTDTFLSQSLVCAVLKELGETEPEKLLVNLLADVRRRLVAPARSAGGPT